MDSSCVDLRGGQDICHLQSLFLGEYPWVPDLYYRTVSHPNPDLEHTEAWSGQVSLPTGKVISSDTYFNALYESFLCRHTRVRDVVLNLRYRGDVFLEIQRTDRGRKPAALRRLKLNGGVGAVVEVPIRLEQGVASRVSFLATGLSDDAAIGVGEWLVKGAQPTPVKLAIVMCTFRREEWLRRNVARLLSSHLKHLPITLIVVDNASELDLPPSPQLRVLKQENVGGTGGFARGILEAFVRDGSFTHVLLMDDDVDVEPEVISRTLHLLSLIDESDEACLSGAMLDRFEPHRLYECGAKLDKRRGKLTQVISLLQNQDLREPDVLEKCGMSERLDYGAWWFFAFSKVAWAKAGMPMPCFIRGDDKEYGLRLRGAGYPTICPPGIGLWHEPFYAKQDAWLHYFDLYNCLITGLIGQFDHCDSASVRYTVRKAGMGFINSAQYTSARLVLDAVEDVLEGSRRFFEVRRRFDAVRQVAKTHASQAIAPGDVPMAQRRTGFGHLVDGLCRIAGMPVGSKVVSMHGVTRSRLRRYQCLYVYNPYSTHLEVRRRDRRLERELKRRLATAASRLQLNWRALQGDFRNAMRQFRSIEFWDGYSGTVQDLQRVINRDQYEPERAAVPGRSPVFRAAIIEPAFSHAERPAHIDDGGGESQSWDATREHGGETIQSGVRTASREYQEAGRDRIR